jgi:hypothetical protein
MTVCEECHNKIHNNTYNTYNTHNTYKPGYIQTSEGIKLELKENLENSCIVKDIKDIKDVKEVKDVCIEMRKSGNSFTKILEFVKNNYDKDITLYRIKKILKV